MLLSSVDEYYIWSNVLPIYRQPVGGGGQYLHPYYSGKPCNESVTYSNEFSLMTDKNHNNIKP